MTVHHAAVDVAETGGVAAGRKPAPDGDRGGIVSLNGALVRSEAAVVSVFDHGLLYGDGVFDTMFASHGLIFRLADHLDRFRRSLRAIRLALPIPEERLESEILRTVAANGLRDAYIKVVATRGVSVEPLLDPRDCSPTLIVFARPYLSLADRSRLAQGISAKLTSIRRIGLPALDPRIKSLDYLNLVLAKLEAIAAGADEALLLDGDGLVCEAPGYNVFVVRSGHVVTPDRSILEGITRATVLELCRLLSIPATAQPIAPYDVLTADEVFLTSTAGGLVPVVRVDGATIGDGKPGPVLRRIDTAYGELQRSGRYGTLIPGPETAREAGEAFAPMTIKVFQVDPLPQLEPWTFEREAIERAGGELVVGDCHSEAEVVSRADDAEILWVSWEPFVTRGVMAALPKCRLVVRWGVGYDQIPVAAATELGVAVGNAPAYGTEDVAEHAIGLLLAASRHIAWFHCAMAAGAYPDSTIRSIHRMTGRTLGLVGVGRIGSAVARRGLGLGLRVIGFDAYRPAAELREMGVEAVGMDRLLAESDFVSLHVPLNDETRGLLTRERLASLRPEAILVNTSRGPVVDEAALVEALRSGRIAAAGLDVFEREPLPVDSPLRTLDNVVLTPHSAGFSIEAWADLRADMCNTAADWIRDGWSARVVNPEVRARLRPRLVD